jgi:hypothetical protein
MNVVLIAAGAFGAGRSARTMRSHVPLRELRTLPIARCRSKRRPIAKAEMPRQKPLKLSLSRTEQRAAQTDTWVRAHLARCRDAEKAKTSHLKALREAEGNIAAAIPRDAANMGLRC